MSLVDVDADGLGKAVQEINAHLGEDRCIGVTADVTDQEQVAGAFQRTVLAFGGLDVLVSNAGIAPTGPWMSYPCPTGKGVLTLTPRLICLFRRKRCTSCAPRAWEAT